MDLFDLIGCVKIQTKSQCFFQADDFFKKGKKEFLNSPKIELFFVFFFFLEEFEDSKKSFRN